MSLLCPNFKVLIDKSRRKSLQVKVKDTGQYICFYFYVFVIVGMNVSEKNCFSSPFSHAQRYKPGEPPMLLYIHMQIGRDTESRIVLFVPISNFVAIPFSAGTKTFQESSSTERAQRRSQDCLSPKHAFGLFSAGPAMLKKLLYFSIFSGKVNFWFLHRNEKEKKTKRKLRINNAFNTYLKGKTFYSPSTQE